MYTYTFMQKNSKLKEKSTNTCKIKVFLHFKRSVWLKHAWKLSVWYFFWSNEYWLFSLIIWNLGVRFYFSFESNIIPGTYKIIPSVFCILASQAILKSMEYRILTKPFERSEFCFLSVVLASEKNNYVTWKYNQYSIVPVKVW